MGCNVSALNYSDPRPQGKLIDTMKPVKYPAINRRQILNFAATLVLGGFIFLSPPATAKTLSGPEQHVTNIATSVIRLANSNARGLVLHAKFKRLLATHANMNAVAIFALGPYRRKLPSNLKSRYQKLVKAYIAGLFVYYAGDFKGRKLVIRSSRKSGKSVIIDSRIKFPGSTKPVKWRVYRRGSRYRVTDVNIRGIWLSIQMRQKFTQILKRNKGDFRPLLAFLAKYKNWLPKN